LGPLTDQIREQQIETLLTGRVPALGAAYGLKVIIDDGLAKEPEIYLEGGDHAGLVYISGSTFQQLLADAHHAQFTDAA